MKILKQLKRLQKDESGVTAIEYALLAGLLATAVIAAVGLLGPAISTAFQNIGTTLTTNT